MSIAFPTQTLSHVEVLDVRIDDVSAAALIAQIEHAIQTKQRMLVLNVNAHLLNLAYHSPWLRQLYQRAEIVFCDGFGAALAAWVVSGRRPARSTPPDWIDPLVQRLAAQGASLYWLGGADGVARLATEKLAERHGIKIAGSYHGYFSDADTADIIAAINDARPDILLLSLGMPSQERFVDQAWHRLNVTVCMTTGALVDYVAGTIPRGPRWATDHGLEWLCRLVIEPQRLWQRYVIGLPMLCFRVAGSILHRNPRYPFTRRLR